MRCRISANWQRSNCIRAGDRRSPLQQTGCAANAPNIGTSILPRTASRRRGRRPRRPVQDTPIALPIPGEPAIGNRLPYDRIGQNTDSPENGGGIGAFCAGCRGRQPLQILSDSPLNSNLNCIEKARRSKCIVLLFYNFSSSWRSVLPLAFLGRAGSFTSRSGSM